MLETSVSAGGIRGNCNKGRPQRMYTYPPLCTICKCCTNQLHIFPEFTKRSSEVQKICEPRSIKSLNKNWGGRQGWERNPENNKGFSSDLNEATPHSLTPALTITLQSIRCSWFLFTPEPQKIILPNWKKVRKQSSRCQVPGNCKSSSSNAEGTTRCFPTNSSPRSKMRPKEML